MVASGLPFVVQDIARIAVSSSIAALFWPSCPSCSVDCADLKCPDVKLECATLHLEGVLLVIGLIIIAAGVIGFVAGLILGRLVWRGSSPPDVPRFRGKGVLGIAQS